MEQETRDRNSIYRVYFRIHPRADRNGPWTDDLPLRRDNNRFRADVPWLTISKHDYLATVDGNSLLKLTDEQLQNILGRKRVGGDGIEGDDVYLDIISNPDDQFLEDLVATKKVRQFFTCIFLFLFYFF